LCGIKQIEKEVLEQVTGDIFLRLDGLGLLTSIKGSLKENPAYRIRLSDKGKKLLTDMSYEGSADEETEVLTNWLVQLYKSKSGGIVKNKTEIKRRIQWFKTITGVSGNKLATLLQCFINDTYNEQEGVSVKEFMENNPRGVLSNMLDNVCWQPTSLYDKHKTLDKSPLWQYFEDNKEYVEHVWKSKNLE
jgi:5'-deoxynucleotidase YfbR-like HD superfamily hydrolase